MSEKPNEKVTPIGRGQQLEAYVVPVAIFEKAKTVIRKSATIDDGGEVLAVLETLRPQMLDLTPPDEPPAA